MRTIGVQNVENRIVVRTADHFIHHSSFIIHHFPRFDPWVDSRIYFRLFRTMSRETSSHGGGTSATGAIARKGSQNTIGVPKVANVTSTNDEALLISAARDFARAELLERDRQWDRGQGSVADVLPLLADMGFLNIILPEDVGGLGCTYRTYAAILHEISYAAPSAMVTVSVHNMVGHILHAFAPECLRAECLDGWGQVDHFGAFAISEANAGSDPSASRTRAERKGDRYILNGEKMWITNGLTARWFLTLARTEPGTGKSGLSTILVDGNSPGLERTPILGKMGIRGSETAVIAFSDVEVPCENRQIGRASCRERV